ncbi:MAG TPA: sulfotransferase [Allosphingosinicella sp.]|nr:sulfotransferase [Allosphingosinicella sp.]
MPFCRERAPKGIGRARLDRRERAIYPERVVAPVSPESLLAEAARHRAAGRIEEAIVAYERALAMRPEAPNSWYNLARLQRQAGRFEAALESYSEALRRGAEGPEEIHLNRAVIYADDLLAGDEAECELRAALALRPDYVPALLNLGNLREDKGEGEAAAAAYRRALELEPDNATALARLTNVSGDDPPLERVRARIAASARADERAELGFALGQALDRLGAYDEAFAAYSAANRASGEASGARYDRAGHEAFVDRVMRAFPSPEPRRGEAGPIFILGMFRSGSTLVEQMLARHSRVTAGGEIDLIPALAARLHPYPERAAIAEAEALASLRGFYLDAVAARRPETDFVTDKRPDNFLHVGLIKRLFPAARIVHTTRDPVDNILSLFFLHLDPSMAYALGLEDAAHWYRQYRRLMAHWKALYPDDIYDLPYDRLVAQPRDTLAGLLAFLGLDWEEACLAYEGADNLVRTASAAQVRRPLYRGSSGRWRHYERHLGPLLAALS